MMVLKYTYWQDGPFFVGFLKDNPKICAQGKTLREFEKALVKAYKTGPKEQLTRSGLYRYCKEANLINRKALDVFKQHLGIIIKHYGSPIHINSLLLVINHIPEFRGPDVPYRLYKLSGSSTLRMTVKYFRQYLKAYPPRETLYKTFMASFFNSLDDSLVDKSVPAIRRRRKKQ